MAEQRAAENIKFLDSDVPEFSAEAAAEVARELYGVEGEFKRLYSERDQNYRIRQADGATVVLKFANSDEDPAVLDLQHQALIHIEQRDSELPVPRVIRTTEGALSDTVKGADGRRHIVRLLSYMPGIDLGEVAQTPTLHRNLGATVARLDLALRGFFHPAADHVLLWDLKRAPELRRNTDAIADTELRGRIDDILDHFTAEVLPRLGGLRNQIIHNDANAGNVLVAEDDHECIAGIIDYGDMVHGALILDLTMAAAGVAHHTDDPVQAMCEVAAGYDAVVPLEADEIDLLYDLVVARLVTEYVICNWRIVHPTSSDVQFLIDFCTAFEGALERMLAVGRKAARDRLRRALQFPPYCPPTEEPDESADARFIRTRTLEGKTRLIQGGLFSLDGMHPTITGSAIVAHGVLQILREAGVPTERDDVDWDRVLEADTLLNDPPPLLSDLHALLTFLDRRGLLSAIMELF